MSKKSISEWKKEIVENYEGTHPAYIVGKNSYSDWGNGTVRRFLGREVSPFGGVYHVYSANTIAREEELKGK